MPGSHGCGPTKRRRLRRRTAHSRSKEGATMAKANSAAPIRVIEETPAYWRVVFDYPPFNILDATIFESLQDLLVLMDASQNLRVVIFRGASSEFVLACDMRFASRKNTRLGQPEVGVGVHPGGGGTERLPHLVGRGRALGDTAERYGYVNRSLPDAELDGFVDALARRIASFDRRAISAAKNLVNHVSLPSADRLLAAITSFETALTWPETQQRIQALLKRGLQRDSDFETRWPEVLGTLLET